MLESRGFETIDVGVDASAETFVEKAIQEKADIICCSALLTTTMPEMKRVVEIAEEKGIRQTIKIMIGGAPVTEKYCTEIGADGYSQDAVSAADLVNGIDWIAAHFRRKTCVELDIDRQSVTHHGSQQDIDDLIREEVEKIGTPQGGLMLIYGLYPGVPLENAEALLCALEKYTRRNM